jgi:hypothetical protein
MKDIAGAWNAMYICHHDFTHISVMLRMGIPNVYTWWPPMIRCATLVQQRPILAICSTMMRMDSRSDSATTFSLRTLLATTLRCDALNLLLSHVCCEHRYCNPQYAFCSLQYWRDSGPDVAEEIQQFQDLTEYLMTTYQGTNKTFVLQVRQRTSTNVGVMSACIRILTLYCRTHNRVPIRLAFRCCNQCANASNV